MARFGQRKSYALMGFILMGFGVFIFYITTGIAMLHQAQHTYDALSISGNFSNAEIQSLVKVLRNATLEDGKTVILAPLNSAWANPGGILDIFLEAFRVGEGINYLLNHLVIIALDKPAYVRCLATHRHCFLLTTYGVDLSGEQFYMSEDYVKMNKRRLYFQGIVLQLGFDFIFTDIDIVWLRSPLEHFSTDADFQVTCDKFSQSTPNMGLVYARSNERTIRFFEFWHQQNLLHFDINEQEIFSNFRYSPEFLIIGVKLEYLSTLYFGGLCEKINMDITKICTIHANCCKGTWKKLADLKLIIEDWKFYKSLGDEQRRGLGFRAPIQCRKTLVQFLQ